VYLAQWGQRSERWPRHMTAVERLVTSNINLLFDIFISCIG